MPCASPVCFHVLRNVMLSLVFKWIWCSSGCSQITNSWVTTCKYDSSEACTYLCQDYRDSLCCLPKGNYCPVYNIWVMSPGFRHWNTFSSLFLPTKWQVVDSTNKYKPLLPRHSRWNVPNIPTCVFCICSYPKQCSKRQKVHFEIRRQLQYQ